MRVHNMATRSLLLCLVAATSGQASFARLSRQTSNNSESGYDFVDPLIGTRNGGHVFAGATLPFGMAKPVADVTEDNQGGYASNGSPVTGFSHMHDSGTGGASSLANFPIFVYPGCTNDELNGCVFPKTQRAVEIVDGSVSARPGYFTISLESGIKAEITATNHTALYSFTFFGNATGNATVGDAPLSPLFIVDLTDLPDTRRNGSASVDPDTGRMSGSGTFEPSFGTGTYNLHFCADFPQGTAMRETGVFVNNRAGSEPKSIVIGQDNNSPPLPAGTYTWFDEVEEGTTITIRVGLSFISVDQACKNAEAEIPDFDFSKTLAAAEDIWNDKLSVIDIDTTGFEDDDLKIIFWSGVYRAMLSPQDYTGENYLWESDEPYYDSWYCIWDSFRSIHPFITLVDPYSQTLMIRSLIDIYRHEGWLPDCRMSLSKGWTQGGSNADVVLVDAYLKNITQDVDWETGYEALIRDAEDEPPVWDYEGRGGLYSWKNLGYIPADDFDPYGNGLITRSISRTVEYAYDDFCIAEIAKALGKEDDYEKYTERSGNWINLYNPDQTSKINGTDTGFTGFLQPKYLNGTWGYQDTALCSPVMSFDSCYLNPGGHETYEGSPWLYTFFAPHDMAALITTLGGPVSFVDRLDFLHESGILYVGDEQAFLTIFQYHYAGRPGKSTERVHYYIPSQFNTTTAGIPGNDDSGAMGSFVALAMLGIFPNPGQDVYFITAPFFSSVSITNGMTGKTATIKTTNFDTAYENIYIQSAKLDGEDYTKNYLTHSFFLEGGTLELELGNKESTTWGTGEGDVPPSLSTST